MQITPLTLDMLEFRLAEETGTGRDWFVPHIADLIRYSPTGCLGLTDDGQPVGMITSTPYGEVGWLGWLYVAERYRGCGLGERLMQAGIAALERQGVTTILLEAVERAVPLYARLGFRELHVTEHFVLLEDSLARDRSIGIDVRPTSDLPFDALVDFDRSIFRYDRAALLRSAMARDTFHGLAALREGRLVGLACSTRNDRYYHCGPLIVDPEAADKEAILTSLFCAIIEQRALPLYLRCPLVAPDRAQPLKALGAQLAGYRTVRMRRGRAIAPDHAGILSLGCPGKG